MLSTCSLPNACNTTALTAIPQLSRALLHVASWGRNSEGQCGIDTGPFVMAPTTVSELDGAAVRNIAAGKLNSCAVLSGGDAWTWGCGKSGKLGHGGSDAQRTPARVEALVDRADVVQAALGDNHTVFLDSNGWLWGCGENKEGQCGLGTPYDASTQAAQQQQRLSLLSFHEQFRVLQSRPLGASLSTSLPTTASQHLLQSLNPQPTTPSPSLLHPTAPLNTRHAHHPTSASSMATSTAPHLRQPTPTPYPTTSQWPQLAHQPHKGLTAPEAFSLETSLMRTGMRPGDAHLPVRVGAPHHPLLGFSMASWMAEQLEPSLEHQVVRAITASKAFTAAATARGSIWTLGAISRTGSAQLPSELRGEVEQVLQQHGGAVQLRAGETFCLALTADGSTVVWGRLPTGTCSRHNILNSTPSAGQVVTLIPALPPITHIAAGQHHALLSDGKSIWAIGRWVTAAGREAGSAPAAAPQLLVPELESGVKRLAAGTQSSAAVGNDGRLWMWGKLMDKHHAEGLFRRTGTSAGSSVGQEGADWSWAGYGADQPQVVEGLDGVVDVALGGWHALAVLE